MANSDDPKAEASAEKAYAAAASAIEPAAPADTAPVEFPAKQKRARKPRAEAAPAPAVTEPVAVKPVVAAPEPAPLKLVESVKATKPKGSKRATPKAVKPAKVAAKAVAKPVIRPVVAKARPAKKPAKRPAPAVAAKATAPLAKPAVVKTAAIKPAIKPVSPAAPKAASPVVAAKSKLPLLIQLKDIPMDMTSSIKNAFSGAQEKAKEAFQKTSSAATECGEFAKGNVEAVVESGKILASGLQAMGTGFIADSKAAFDTATADVKALTGVKSPTDFFQMQSDLARRNFDSAVAYGSKASEAMMKLTNEVMAPLSTRVNLAVEKIKAAA